MKDFGKHFIMLILVITPFLAAPPPKAEAAANSSFSQTILPPSCYDVVSSAGPTIDYIATFECEYRTPDGKVYVPANQAI